MTGWDSKWRGHRSTFCSVRTSALLEAVAFVDETTASELLRPVVAAYLTKQRNEPEVEAALAALQSRRARKAGRLSDLRERIASDRVE